jgi:hypothetical protein
MDLYPLWMQMGAGGSASTVIVDSFDVQLEGDVHIELVEDEIFVSIEPEIDVEVDD